MKKLGFLEVLNIGAAKEFKIRVGVVPLDRGTSPHLLIALRYGVSTL